MSVTRLRPKLTQSDIVRLSERADPEARALAARKVCARIAGATMSAQDRAAAQEILRMLAADAAVMVRRALAVTLQKSANLPRDVARKLAADLDTIAVPVITSSPVLEDDDLIEIVRSGEALRQSAVASRARVSPLVVQEMVERAAPGAVGTLAANDGAAFAPKSYTRALERFKDRSDVLERFIDRASLPLEVTERLIARVSDEAMQRLVRRHALPAQLAVELSEGARERATVDLVEQAGLSPDPRRFVQQMQMNGRLTPSLILRALFRGHVAFVEHAMAELAGVEHAKAAVLIHDAGPLGLDALFDRTGLPRRILPAVRAAIETYHSLEIGAGGAVDQARFRKRLCERIFTQFQGAPEEDLAYCLARIDDDQEIVAAGATRAAS